MTLRVASNHGRFGLVGLLALAACAANRAPLAVPSPAIAAPTPTSAAVTQAPAPAGWPSAQNATTTGRPTPIAGGGCVDPIARANVSRSRAHHIVLPSDGSDAGWRDPVISFTAFIDEGDGCWKPLERAPVMRCGLFDVKWEDDVVKLAAGSKRVIDPLWGFPSFQWRTGKVRLFLHYAWTGGAASKGGTQSVDPASSPSGLGAMAREKPYELVSNAIELEVTA